MRLLTWLVGDFGYVMDVLKQKLSTGVGKTTWPYGSGIWSHTGRHRLSLPLCLPPPPGAWLILRHGDGTRKPWGSLEAWRERGSSDGLGYRFELLANMSSSAAGILLAESTLGTGKGGKFMIDMSGNGRATPANSCSPACSLRSSGDFGYGLWSYCLYRDFVMSSTVEGEGKCSKPMVEVGVQHVSGTEDATVFVALLAAIDLSMDACKLFSHKLRKELIQQ